MQVSWPVSGMASSWGFSGRLAKDLACSWGCTSKELAANVKEAKAKAESAAARELLAEVAEGS